MWRLVGYEWKRILGSRMTRLVLLGCVLFLAFCVYSQIQQLQAWDENGKPLNGLAAARHLREVRKEENLTQSRIQEIMEEYLGYTEGEDTGSGKESMEFLSEKLYTSYYLQNQELLQLLSGTYQLFGEDISKKEIFQQNLNRDFYQVRRENTANWLTNAEGRGEVTPIEREYWLSKDQKVGVYQYGYYEGWRKVLDASGWALVIMMAISVGIAPIFAGECQSKFDSILLCMKHGRGRLIRAKLLAAFLYTSAVYWGILLGVWAVYLGILGTEGGGLPIQIYYQSRPVSFDLTMNQAAVLTAFLGYLANLAMMGIVLEMSSIMKHTYGVIVCAFLGMIIPSFLFPNMGGYLWQHVLALIPAKITDFSFQSYLAYSAGGKVWALPTMLVMVDLIGAAAMGSFAYVRFRKHQVNR